MNQYKFLSIFKIYTSFYLKILKKILTMQNIKTKKNGKNYTTICLERN